MGGHDPRWYKVRGPHGPECAGHVCVRVWGKPWENEVTVQLVAEIESRNGVEWVKRKFKRSKVRT